MTAARSCWCRCVPLQGADAASHYVFGPRLEDDRSTWECDCCLRAAMAVRDAICAFGSASWAIRAIPRVFAEEALRGIIDEAQAKGGEAGVGTSASEGQYSSPAPASPFPAGAVSGPAAEPAERSYCPTCNLYWHHEIGRPCPTCGIGLQAKPRNAWEEIRKGRPLTESDLIIISNEGARQALLAAARDLEEWASDPGSDWWRLKDKDQVIQACAERLRKRAEELR